MTVIISILFFEGRFCLHRLHNHLRFLLCVCFFNFLFIYSLWLLCFGYLKCPPIPVKRNTICIQIEFERQTCIIELLSIYNLNGHKTILQFIEIIYGTIYPPVKFVVVTGLVVHIH